MQSVVPDETSRLMTSKLASSKRAGGKSGFVFGDLCNDKTAADDWLVDSPNTVHRNAARRSPKRLKVSSATTVPYVDLNIDHDVSFEPTPTMTLAS